MGEVLAVVLLAVTAFASTNIDDLAILAIFFSNRRYAARNVVIGQYLGVGALVLISLGLALAATAVSSDWLRWLGVLPIVIGVKWFFDARKASGENDDDAATRAALQSGPTTYGLRSSLTVAGVTFANGADNVGVYVPMFASSSTAETAAIAGIFGAMIGVWCLAGYLLTRNPVTGEKIAGIAGKIAPFVLIAIGLAIILEVA